MNSEITKMNLSSFYEGTPLANADISWENNGESPLVDVVLNLLIGTANADGTFSYHIMKTKTVSLTPYSSILTTISNIDISMLPKGNYDVVAFIAREGVQISPTFLTAGLLEILGPQYSALINSVSFSS